MGVAYQAFWQSVYTQLPVKRRAADMGRRYRRLGAAEGLLQIVFEVIDVFDAHR